MQKIWYSIFDFSFDYKGTESSFIEPDKYAWAKELSDNTEKMYQELEKYVHQNNLQSYFNTSMVSKKNTWRTVSLKTWSVELYKNQKHFPYTTSLIKKYPQIVSASFNLLEPNSKILSHCGDTNAIYRCHLGLDIPAGLPDCGFRVRNDLKSWEKGKWLIFMDAYNHEAWNNTNGGRYIFLIDVMRDEFVSRKKNVCATVLTSLFLQKRAEIFKINIGAKPCLTIGVAKLLVPFAKMAVILTNKLKIY